MKKILLLLTGLGLLLFSACKKRPTDTSAQQCVSSFGWTDSSASHPKQAVYSALMDELTTMGLPGITLMVEDAHGLWYRSSGYADIGAKTAMQPCHLGKIASVTKLFTAVMIYKLAEQGKIGLDDPITKYFSEDEIGKIEQAKQCRISDLLAHQSGIYDVVFDADFILYTFNNLDKDKSYERLLKFAYGKKATFPYGSKREYNQTLNHVLLAMIVNKVTGEDQSLMLRREILAPLGMKESYIRPQEDIPWDRVAKGYYDYRKKGLLQDLTPLFTGDGRGFTGIYSTANDLRLFTNALYRQKTLLNASSLAHMTAIPSLDTTLACAGGCRAMRINVGGQDFTWYGHPGGEVNYAAGAFYSPEAQATISFIVNYGVAFTELGAYTQAYYDFRKKLFVEVSRP
jgi:D-alanyl-D-alanine carboxypeptidase